MLQDTDVSVRIRYQGRVLDAPMGLMLVHRTDYHEDGSQTEHYYLDLEKPQYDVLFHALEMREPERHEVT